MTTPKPNFMDLRSASQASLTQSHKSPRLHVAGEIPPELSPLDAFAMQSRLLAKQLEESAKSDKRMSRLPPLTASSPLVFQARSEFFRSLSQDSYSDHENSDSAGGANQPHDSASTSQTSVPGDFSTRTPEVEVPSVRPQSMHPRMSHVSTNSESEPAPPPIPAFARNRQRPMEITNEFNDNVQDNSEQGVFGARRDRSPSPFGDNIAAEQPHQASLEPAPGTCAVGHKQAQTLHVSHPPEQLPMWQQHTPEQPHPRQLHHLPQMLILPSNPQQMQLQQQQHLPPPPLSPYAASMSSVTQSPERIPMKNSFDQTSGGLAPPRSIFPKRSSSIMSSPLEPADEDHIGVGAPYHSLGAPRKLSNSSGMVSPGFGSFHRSPSFDSDLSAPLPRPSFNFSRPLSRVGTPGLESPARQASSDSHTSYSQSSFVLADDSVHTPVSVQSESFSDPSSSSAPESGQAAPSYIYSKFSLPRGKIFHRSNPQSPDIQPTASFQWDLPAVQPSNVQTLPLGGHAPPSPPTRPSSSGGMSFPRPSLERTKLSTEIVPPPSQPSPSPSRPSTEGGRSFEEHRGRSLQPNTHEPQPRGRTPLSIATSRTDGTSDTASTIKPRSMHSLASAIDIPAEEHVDQAIALHEQGLLNESTYHLRHAARQGHPTGMLLYALACRHGWGMRPNAREGAEWLRKAAESASVEIADEEALIKEGKNVNVLKRKTSKAQFALSIYELGVSYLNGWGIDQDKNLALLCFEVAGSWGDIDGLAEAGFCYAQGIGCKKDLKKSAKFYRQAEAKGMSMVGNSWIHKPKYKDDTDVTSSPKSKKEDKVRSKSRTRNIFGIKHSS